MNNIYQCEAMPVEEVYKKEQLLADFDQVVEGIMTKHPKTFTVVSEFKALTLAQRAKIIDMSEYDFFQILAPVIAKMNCGHAYIHYSKQQYADRDKNGNFFPLNVKVINKELYLVDNFSDSYLKKGAKIHAINGQDVANILEEIYASSTSDGGNSSAKLAKLNSEFSSYCPNSGCFNIAYYIFISSPEIFNITYSIPPNVSLINGIIPPKSYVPLPVNNEPLSFSYKNNYAILTISHFYTYHEQEFKTFSRDLDYFFSELKKKATKHLILDLRYNGGGDPNAGNLLLTYLLTYPFQYFNDDVTGTYFPLTLGSQINKNVFNGQLVVLINGLGFSTTGHILSLLVDQKRGTFIGQESGGGYVCNDRSEIIKLNNTKISFNLPTAAFSTSVQGQVKGRGVIANIETKYNIEDYLNNSDLEMNAALDLIQD
ncbi:MAG: hypothetical protein GY951_14295 [Psychromonas sp.]|nr:hypothetical protein [Alteromonadales bacterium]MCP5079211.1 hypothetical protein [Psychromonas sp.]